MPVFFFFHNFLLWTTYWIPPLRCGRTDLAVVAAMDAVDGASKLVDAQTPDVDRLRYHGCRLLFELTTPDAHFPPGEQEGNIKVRVRVHLRVGKGVGGRGTKLTRTFPSTMLGP